MPLFGNAMKFDFEYPARWGGPAGVEMRVDDFAVLWPDGVFPARYKAKGAQLLRDQLKAAEDLKGIALPGDLDIMPCPQCKAPWGLKEGCNHMTCKTCSTSYCFVCGKEALDKSGHWSNPENGGSCPRWGRPADGSGIYDNEQEEEELGWTEQISFETWAWNVTIQNASEPLLLLMQRMLGVPLPNVPQGRMTNRERHTILANMLQYRPEHGVSREVWVQTVADHRHEAMAFMRGIGFIFENNIDEEPIRNGVLARPIGGVFNLSSASARREAYEWAQQAYYAWTPETAENPINYAIFDVGPGTLEDRVQAREMLDSLTMLGFDATGGCLEFFVVESPLGLYLIAQITGLHDHLEAYMARTGRQVNPLSNLRFEFIRPQNGNEFLQRDAMRVEYGWRDHHPQRQVQFDPDFERGVLADIQEMQQNRPPGVEDAADARQEERRRRMDLVDGLRRLTPEERQRQDEGIDPRLLEIGQERLARAAARAAEREDETIAGRDIVPPRAEEAAPRHRRSPFAEQSLEPWVQPWGELTRAMPGSQGNPEGSPTAEGGFGEGL